MLLEVARRWWVFLVRGLCAILFGILAFVWPGITLIALVLLYGAYALVDGITAVAMGVTGRREGMPLWGLILVGVLGIAVGVITFLLPGITAITLLVLIACWAIVRGIFELVAAARLRKMINDEWVLVVGGILSIAFGVILLARPAIGLLTMVWLIGSFAIAFGVVGIVLSLRLHALKNRLEHPGDRGMPGLAV